MIKFEKEQAQTAVLGALACDKTRDFILMSGLTKEWFNGDWQDIASSLLENSLDWIKDFPPIKDLKGTLVHEAMFHTANWDYWLKHLGDCFRYEETAKTALYVSNSAKTGENYSELLENLILAQDHGVIIDNEISYYDNYSDAFYTGKTVLATGYKTLDSKTPIVEGEYILVAGRPSSGKTSFMVNCMLNFVKNDKRVLFFAMDDTLPITLDKIACLGMGVDQATVRSSTNREWVKEYFLGLEQAKFSLAPQKIIDIDSIIRYARQRKAIEPDLRVIVIDHITKIRGVGNNIREKVTDISTKLFHLSKTLGVTVFAISQLNRSSENEGRKMRMSDMRESGSLEEDATKVLGFYLPEPREDGAMEWSVNCDVLKNKMGNLGTVFMKFTGCKYLLEEFN